MTFDHCSMFNYRIHNNIKEFIKCSAPGAFTQPMFTIAWFVFIKCYLFMGLMVKLYSCGKDRYM